MLVIAELGRLRQDSKFDASLGWAVKSCLKKKKSGFLSNNIKTY